MKENVPINIFKFGFYDKELYEESLKIRKEVFVKEQGVPETEEEEYEEVSTFFLLFYDGKPAATARYRHTEKGVKLERFATLKKYRGKGLAYILLNYVLKDLKNCKKMIYLHAQEYIVGLYEKVGFVKKGNTFYEANIPHYLMVLENTIN
jgi:predicted GNAT family N-acyltransferase